MNRQSRRNGFTVMGLGLPLCAPGLVDTQAGRSSPQMHVCGDDAKPDDIEKLRAWAEAAMKLEDIRCRWLLEVREARQANRPDEAERLRKRATTEMLQAIDATPALTFEEYQTIALLAKSDKDVWNKIEQIVRESDTRNT